MEQQKRINVLWLPWDSKTTASSRIRCYDLVPYFKEFTEYNIQIWPWDKTQWTYKELEWPDIVVFQKNYISNNARNLLSEFTSRQKKIVFDLSDSEWYDIRRIPFLNNMLYRSNAIVYTTDPIKEWLVKNQINEKLLHHIPDRFDLSQYPESNMKLHSDKNSFVIGWHGNKNTIKNLEILRPAIEKLAKDYLITVLTISNKDSSLFSLNFKCLNIHKVWKLETYEKDLLQADIIVNPRLDIEENKGKSNNKTVLAWLMGQPCVSYDSVKDWYEDIKNLIVIGAEGRSKIAFENRKKAEEIYDLRISAKEWIKCFEGLK